jgi:Rod binding domain-containing protein
MSLTESMPGLSLTNIDAMGLYENLRNATSASQMQQDQSRLEKTAGEFEGLFLSLLLKEMRGTLQNGGFFGEEGSDTFGGMFDLFLGQHLAKSTPLGIADMIRNTYPDSQKRGDSGSISIRA